MRTRAVSFAARIFTAIVFGLACTSSVFAQTSGGGTIHAQVTDPSAAAIVGASVIVKGPDGKSRTTTTDRDGVFELKNLAPGKYTVAVSAKGFALYNNDSVQVTVGENRREANVVASHRDADEGRVGAQRRQLGRGDRRRGRARAGHRDRRHRRVRTRP